ncbi:MAG TPA: carboxymuconolactone decarboxylase family protein [Sediminibacterium sp.]|nr:carboxymuconolactone decarboxylase family protein [Sediminibacterium sp.]
MEQRVNIQEKRPDVYKALYNLSTVLVKSTLSHPQKNLIKLRASQLNHCAFCLNMHTSEALQAGESMQRIVLLSAWRETDLFTAEEKTLLSLTEEVTLIHTNGVSDQVYQEAMGYFGEEGVADIILAAMLINAWNRIAVSTHLPVSVDK